MKKVLILVFLSVVAILTIKHFSSNEKKISSLLLYYGIPVGIMCFSDVQVTDNAIYAVFHGTKFKEIAKQNGRHPDGGSIFMSSI